MTKDYSWEYYSRLMAYMLHFKLKNCAINLKYMGIAPKDRDEKLTMNPNSTNENH